MLISFFKAEKGNMGILSSAFWGNSVSHFLCLKTLMDLKTLSEGKRTIFLIIEDSSLSTYTLCSVKRLSSGSEYSWCKLRFKSLCFSFALKLCSLLVCILSEFCKYCSASHYMLAYSMVPCEKWGCMHNYKLCFYMFITFHFNKQ